MRKRRRCVSRQLQPEGERWTLRCQRDRRRWPLRGRRPVQRDQLRRLLLRGSLRRGLAGHRVRQQWRCVPELRGRRRRVRGSRLAGSRHRDRVRIRLLPTDLPHVQLVLLQRHRLLHDRSVLPRRCRMMRSVGAVLCTALGWAACGGQTVGTAAGSDASTDSNEASRSASSSSGGGLDGSSLDSAAEEAGLPPGSPPPPLPPLTGFGPGCFPQVDPGTAYATDAGCITNQDESCSDGGLFYQATCACPQSTCACVGASTNTVAFTGCPTCPTLPQAFKLCGFPQ